MIRYSVPCASGNCTGGPVVAAVSPANETQNNVAFQQCKEKLAEFRRFSKVAVFCGKTACFRIVSRPAACDVLFRPGS